MKKTLISLLLLVTAGVTASAQKYAMVDMDYILRNVPAYEMASEQLNQLSQRWQREVEAVGKRTCADKVESLAGQDAHERGTLAAAHLAFG